MSKKRHKPEEIVAKLRQVEVLTAQGRAVAEAIRSNGVTEVTFYRWRQEYGGLKGDQVKRLKELEAENARLGFGRLHCRDNGPHSDALLRYHPPHRARALELLEVPIKVERSTSRDVDRFCCLLVR